MTTATLTATKKPGRGQKYLTTIKTCYLKSFQLPKAFLYKCTYLVITTQTPHKSRSNLDILTCTRSGYLNRTRMEGFQISWYICGGESTAFFISNGIPAPKTPECSDTIVGTSHCSQMTIDKNLKRIDSPLRGESCETQWHRSQKNNRQFTDNQKKMCPTMCNNNKNNDQKGCIVRILVHSSSLSHRKAEVYSSPSCPKVLLQPNSSL